MKTTVIGALKTVFLTMAFLFLISQTNGTLTCFGATPGVSITGKIVDRAGAGVNSSTIELVGTTLSTVSNADGEFSLTGDLPVASPEFIKKKIHLNINCPGRPLRTLILPSMQESLGEIKIFSQPNFVIIFTDDQGSRGNQIQVYLQNDAVYPRNNPFRWYEDTSIFPGPGVWNNPAVVMNSDDSLTSEGFFEEKPAEVAVHAFYDSPAQNEQFFDNFSMRVAGYVGEGSGGDQQQY